MSDDQVAVLFMYCTIFGLGCGFLCVAGVCASFSIISRVVGKITKDDD